MIKKFTLVALSSYLAACTSSTHIQWSNVEAEEGIFSKNIPVPAYTTQGVDVKGTSNWFYGNTAGIKSHLVHGGMIYIETDASAAGELDGDNEAQVSGGAVTESTNVRGEKILETPSGGQHPTYFDRYIIKGDFIASVHFPLNKHNALYEESEAEFGEYLKSLSPDTSVVLVGYTDDIGLDDYNIPLSGKRSAYIHKRIEQAHPGIKILSIASGPSPRLKDNRAAGGRKGNRRVEIYHLHGE